MHQRSRFLRWIVPGDGRPLSASALLQGRPSARGALVMTTLVGVAAVVGMNLQGLSPDAILQSLQQGWRFGFCRGGRMADGHRGRLCRGCDCRSSANGPCFLGCRGTIVLKFVTWLLLGNPWPIGLAAIDLTLVVPCALLGGYLGVAELSADRAKQPGTRRLDDHRGHANNND